MPASVRPARLYLDLTRTAEPETGSEVPVPGREVSRTEVPGRSGDRASAPDPRHACPLRRAGVHKTHRLVQQAGGCGDGIDGWSSTHWPPRGRAGGPRVAPRRVDVVPADDGGPSTPPALTFPDLPRLELDQLLGQLVERAQEVMATQGRLRGLLRASQMVTGDLALPVVLRRIVEAARELVGARYAALGVISPTGGLAEFVHTGMPPETVGAIGHLPQGKGLLGALIEEPRPIRLRRSPTTSARRASRPSIRRWAASSACRSGSGTRCSATSTWPRARGASSAPRTRSSPALAATAAVAIENARLYETARLAGRVAAGHRRDHPRRMLSAEPRTPATRLRLIAGPACGSPAPTSSPSCCPAGPEELLHRRRGRVGADGLAGTRVPMTVPCPDRSSPPASRCARPCPTPGPGSGR